MSAGVGYAESRRFAEVPVTVCPGDPTVHMIAMIAGNQVEMYGRSNLGDGNVRIGDGDVTSSGGHVPDVHFTITGLRDPDRGDVDPVA
jgi:hypothetical protein